MIFSRKSSSAPLEQASARNRVRRDSSNWPWSLGLEDFDLEGFALEDLALEDLALGGFALEGLALEGFALGAWPSEASPGAASCRSSALFARPTSQETLCSSFQFSNVTPSVMSALSYTIVSASPKKRFRYNGRMFYRVVFLAVFRQFLMTPAQCAILYLSRVPHLQRVDNRRWKRASSPSYRHRPQTLPLGSKPPLLAGSAPIQRPPRRR